MFRLAATHPEDVRSLTATEMGLAGFGLDGLADVTHGGSRYIGVLAAPGVPEMLFAGRERELLGDWAFPAMTAVPGPVTDADIDEFARACSRPGGWRGAAGLYRSMLSEGDEIREPARTAPLTVPVLAVGAGGGPSPLRPSARSPRVTSAPSSSTSWPASTPTEPWVPDRCGR